jgi:hypothetical protein
VQAIKFQILEQTKAEFQNSRFAVYIVFLCIMIWVGTNQFYPEYGGVFLQNIGDHLQNRYFFNKLNQQITEGVLFRRNHKDIVLNHDVKEFYGL